MPMREIWARIEAWLEANVPSGASVLSTGAADEEIADTERFLGVSFPEDFRASLRLHDGQCGGPWLMWGCDLLSLAGIREQWSVWKDLLDRGTFKDVQCDSDGRVVKNWWHERWVPLTHDGSGNHHCLDLNPGPDGLAGQIIEMWHDDPERPVVAPSYRAWLAAFADALEAGEYVYSEHFVGLVPPEDAACVESPEQAAADGGKGFEPIVQRHADDEVRATFRVRRRRQIVLLLLGLPFIVFLGGFKMLIGRVDGLVIGLSGLLTLGYVSFAVVYSLRNWRCPRCNRWLGNQISPRARGGCGVGFGH